jgi:nucleoside-diphosphate-sugar epimerase
MSLYNKLLDEDLRHILSHTELLWNECRGKTLFLTGGTGFFGKWFLETISFANCEMNLGLRTIVLSRTPEKFLSQYPYFDQPLIRFVQGDVRDSSFPKEDIHYIIHAGTSASKQFNTKQPFEVFDTIVNGTRHILDLAKEKKVESLLFTSSGAVYGQQPPEMTHVPESYTGAPDCTDAQSAYGEGKRVGELLCSLYYYQYQVPVKIARCFAFVGPYLPLDTHFAIGNFILNVLKGEDIVIEGDGTPYRSYLYASDLMIWLWTVLLRGKNNDPYNVGSNQDLTIEALAHHVADTLHPPQKILVRQEKNEINPLQRYIPNVDKIKRELGLKQRVDLDMAIKKTYRYEQNRKQ